LTNSINEYIHEQQLLQAFEQKLDFDNRHTVGEKRYMQIESVRFTTKNNWQDAVVEAFRLIDPEFYSNSSAYFIPLMFSYNDVFFLGEVGERQLLASSFPIDHLANSDHELTQEITMGKIEGLSIDTKKMKVWEFLEKSKLKLHVLTISSSEEETNSALFDEKIAIALKQNEHLCGSLNTLFIVCQASKKLLQGVTNLDEMKTQSR